MAPKKRTKKGTRRAAVATPPVRTKSEVSDESGVDGERARTRPDAPATPDESGPRARNSENGPQESAAETWTIADHYEILEKIASGGMCDLYLARHSDLGGQWAVKILAEDLARDPGIVERFLAEARILANLQHPNIVKVVGVGQEKGLHFMVMHYVEGEDLEARLERQGRLPEREIISIAVQITRALECAHESGIVHRDLKPSNIRIDHWGTVVVLDFGIARARDAASRALTRTDDRLGTPLYMSPEQIQGNDVDARSDLYSLGVILYELAEGRNPFEAESQHSVYSKHLYHLPADLKAAAPSVSERFSEIVDRLLRKDPAERPPTASDLLAELRLLGRMTDLKTPKPGDSNRADPAGGGKPREVPATVAPGEAGSPERQEAAAEPPPSAPTNLPPSPQPFDGAKRRTAESLGRLPKRSIAVSLITLFLLAVFMVAAYFWPRPQPVLEQAVTVDASPFAGVEVLDSEGRVVHQDQTPFVTRLIPGSYVVKWSHGGETRTKKIRVPLQDGQILHERFRKEIDIGELVEGYLEASR